MDNADNVSQSWFRPEVLSLPAYVPGKKGQDTDIVKLASNETPFPALPQVQAAVLGALGGLNRYPDMFAADLVADIGRFHEWPDDGVVVGNGSTTLIEKVLQAVVTPSGEVIMAWRSFEAYPIAVQAVGGVCVQVPLTRDGGHDLRAIARAVTPRTRAILLCSPNNPTGVSITHAELAAFLDEVPDSIPVLLDEAYIDFVEMDDAIDSRALLPQHRNLIVLRTFSKAYGLAGLRCGYALCSVDMATGLRAVLTPFGVNSLVQIAARAALNSRPDVIARVATIKAERERLLAAVAAQGWDIPRSQSNFLWFEFSDHSLRFEQLCNEEKIVVRRFGDEGVRVSIAEPSGSVRLLRALERFRAERG
ncbi:histidinol-phosphate transaminase [Actinobaculum sp. 352]|uniref:histidinol-phosphate transaminase n=1 Tax=Actinobaculum sp. 352 TaxID=2490946 RepID=UPI000F7F8817|nr:histidinol-phosphate transaminase [Actinobaculum sp. 352]RTE49894.1 aminotransferase class I/II-fold pyridoxal phosphate-dependent enzyme [Actinobaculum sp. 352]